MKFKYILGTFLVMLCLLTISASASTNNKDLPSESKITDFADEMKGKDATTIYGKFVEEFPSGNCDLWKNDQDKRVISLYFYDPGSTREYGAIYLNDEGKKASSFCDYDLEKKYVGENESGKDKSDDTNEVKDDANDDKKEDKVTNSESDDDNSDEEEEDSEEEEEDSEEEEVSEDFDTTYQDLLDFLEEDDTNEDSFSSSKKCATSLIETLPDQFKDDAKLFKATFKSTGNSGKNPIRYCAGIKTSDEGTVYIDSYHGSSGTGIDKRVTVLKAGQKWQAESACKTCAADASGRYNRGKVLKVQEIDL